MSTDISGEANIKRMFENIGVQDRVSEKYVSDVIQLGERSQITQPDVMNANKIIPQGNMRYVELSYGALMYLLKILKAQ